MCLGGGVGGLRGPSASRRDDKVWGLGFEPWAVQVGMNAL